MTTSKARAEAHDASAATEDGQPVDRPLTDGEREYLRARVADQRAAVSKIEDALDGWKTSLRTAKAELASAEAALTKATGGAE